MAETAAPEILLSATGVFHAHEQGLGWILEGVDLQLPRGQLVHLRGDNGSGKTTLLRLLAGELAPARGRVELLGRPLDPAFPASRAALALVPDNLVPSPWLGPEEFLRFRGALRGLVEPELGTRLTRVLADWELVDLRQQPIGTLSHGERRRVVLAAAWLADPEVFLLDEPTNGLDRRQRQRMRERIVELARGKAVLVTSHVENEDLLPSARVLLLEDGRLSEGKPS